MKTINFLLILSFWLFSAIGNSQTTMTEQVYNPDIKGIENNPMKGLIPGYVGIVSNFPYSADHFYIPLNSVYKDWGTCDWTAFENEITRILSVGAHSVARFWIDYPGKPNSVPAFLLDNIGEKVAMKDENTPDFNDPTLMLAIEDFIALFGAKYDGDPRILMIEAGLNGYFGEWHCYPNKQWEMNQTNKDRIINAYNAAFKKTHIAVRHAGHPSTTALAQTLGFYDDSFCYSTLCTGGHWCFSWSMVEKGVADNYKYHPRGGEIYPSTQRILFDSWPNITTDASGNKVAEDITKSVNESHLSFVKAFGGVFKQQPTPAQFANAMKMHKMMGYQFFVKSVQITPFKSDSFKVDLNFQNRGVAPIYYNWQVEFSAVNSAGEWLQNIGTADWNTNTIYPATIDYQRTFSGKLPSKDTYKILMRFKNPLDTYSPKSRVLRFANEKQDADKEGWLTLGTVNIYSTGIIRIGDELQNDIRIFPNPITTTLNIESDKNRIKEISLYSVSGMLLYNVKPDASTVQIDIRGLNLKDILLVKVNTGQNVSMHKACVW